MEISNNSTVTVHYTGKLEDGTIFDSSIETGREPLKAQLGQGQLIPGFENGLLGMTVGEKKTISIKSIDAYGELNDQYITEISKDMVPEGVEVGAMLQANGPSGTFNVIVKEIRDNTVLLDANHPLAGKDLIFEVEVLNIQ
jgi:FKBP-type peptidyl-prolyl cis-trans isomerase 2